MLVCGKTLEQVKEILTTDRYYEDVPIDSISLKKMITNDEGQVWRLKFKNWTYIQRTWSNELREQTHWLVVKENLVQSGHTQYKNAKRRIGIQPAPTRTEKIVRCKSTHDFDQQICKDAKDSGDLGYCGIRAYCNLTHTPYSEGREICSEYGWSHTGMRTYELVKLLKDQGYTVEDKTEYIRANAKTIKTFEKQGFRESYLIQVSGHFVTSVNGTITDFSHGRKMIIQRAYRITKK